MLYRKASRRLITFDGLKLLCLDLHLNQDCDLREAPSLDNIPLLLERGADIYAMTQLEWITLEKIS
jgi:UDPglucose 6-dehydrogenase